MLNLTERTTRCSDHSNALFYVLQVIHHIALPIFIFYYVMKAAQLIFVFEWTTAKAEHNMDRVSLLQQKHNGLALI